MTKTTCAAPTLGPEETPLERELTETINGLPFGAVTGLVRQLLVQMGYSGVHVRRTRLKGHNQHGHGPGGWDVEATWDTGLSGQKLIAQVKHCPDGPAVQMRSVDELRGAMLRAGASHGLLVTTGTFSDQARLAALAAHESLTLVDGEVLCGLLRAYKVGLKQDEYGDWSLDEALFARLRRLFPARDRGATHRGPGKAVEEGTATTSACPPTPSPLTLTVITTALLRTPPGGEDGTRRTRR